MIEFVHRWYKALFCLLIGLIIGISYYIGYSMGSQVVGQGTILSCDKDTLTTLKIPLNQILSAPEANSTAPIASSGAYVGSKNGKKYYNSNCKAVSRIKPANLIYFKDAQDALMQGYSESTSC